jgi:hypothetical protein
MGGSAKATSFRPAPVLTVAVTGHRDLVPASEEARLIAAAAETVFRALAAEAARIASRDAAFFSPEPPRLRAVSRFDGGGDLTLMAAAERAGCERRAVVAGRTAPPDVAAPLDLGGTPGDPRMRAAGGQALLDRSDLLLVFWRGEPDAVPGSTASLVQQAMRRMPVVVLSPEGEATILDDPQEHLMPESAADAPRVPFAANLDRILARAFAPPQGTAERAALAAFLAEPEAPRSRRPEYRFLMLVAERRRAAGGASLSGAEEWRRAEAAAALVSPEAAAAVARAGGRAARAEELAAFYGERARSGTVLRYGMPAVGGVFIALLAVALPQYSLAWLGVQAVVMTLLVSESTWATHRRWGERWLDYRSLAERLRCDRFLHPYGIGSRRIEEGTGAEDPAWMRWCHRRLAAAEWTGGRIGPEVVAAASHHLVAVEIPGQARYHEGATIRYRSLGRRLGLIATGSVLGMLAASAILVVLPAGRGWQNVATDLLTSLLIVLPSLFLAARGLRAEGGYELAAARSANAAADLRAVARRILAAPATYGRLVEASLGAARAMISDTIDWRVGLQRSRTPYRAPAKGEEAD